MSPISTTLNSFLDPRVDEASDADTRESSVSVAALVARAVGDVAVVMLDADDLSSSTSVSAGDTDMDAALALMSRMGESTSANLAGAALGLAAATPMTIIGDMAGVPAITGGVVDGDIAGELSGVGVGVDEGVPVPSVIASPSSSS